MLRWPGKGIKRDNDIAHRNKLLNNLAWNSLRARLHIVTTAPADRTCYCRDGSTSS